MNPDQTRVENHNGRTWAVSTIDEFIVGRIYGGYNINQILLYITHNNVSLATITVDELDNLWSNVLQNPTNIHYVYWTSMQPEDPRVQAVLDNISTSLLEAQAVMH